MNAEISETIRARLLGLGMEIPELLSQGKFVSAGCHADSSLVNTYRLIQIKFATPTVCGKDNKYATLIFIINNARIGYVKMYSVYSEPQTDCVKARLQDLHIDTCRLTK